ncbi:MAG: hypothetical protein JNJ69_02560 [Leptospiraceae bacterium]|nr:hypothetical protein [Leptospiraceae bacterium]
MKQILLLVSTFLWSSKSSYPCSLTLEYPLAVQLDTVAVVARVIGYVQSGSAVRAKVIHKPQYPDSLPLEIEISLNEYGPACETRLADLKTLQKEFPIGSNFIVIGSYDHDIVNNSVNITTDRGHFAANLFNGRESYIDGSLANLKNIISSREACQTSKAKLDCQNLAVAHDALIRELLVQMLHSSNEKMRIEIFGTIISYPLFKPIHVASAIDLYFRNPAARQELRRKGLKQKKNTKKLL